MWNLRKIFYKLFGKLESLQLKRISTMSQITLCSILHQLQYLKKKFLPLCSTWKLGLVESCPPALIYKVNIPLFIDFIQSLLRFFFSFVFSFLSFFFSKTKNEIKSIQGMEWPLLTKIAFSTFYFNLSLSSLV